MLIKYEDVHVSMRVNARLTDETIRKCGSSKISVKLQNAENVLFMLQLYPLNLLE
jgi:hypothetical protein